MSGVPVPAAPRADDFRALARSSPWRFATVHFTHQSQRGYSPRADTIVEAWVHLDVHTAIAVEITAVDGGGGTGLRNTLLRNEIRAVDRPLNPPPG